MIFVNSMSDLFHKDIPEDFIARVFETIERADWHRSKSSRSGVRECETS
jgi:protein gp37